jgi:hypothetical protein
MKKTRLTMIPLLIIIALWAMEPAAAHADPPIDIDAALITEKSELTVGDPVQITLVVTHPAEHQVIAPELETNWGNFTVLGQSPLTTVNNRDGTETSTQVIDVRLFAPGTFTTPPVPVTVSNGAGELSQVIAPPIDVTITSVLAEGDNELRDIKPQAELPFSALTPWLVGGLLGALALATLAFLWWRRRRARLALVTADNRPPHEVALDELVRITELRLPEQRRFKEHYTLTSDCLRTYMERSYDIPVLERTTGEVQTSLRNASVEPAVARRITAFLDDSDLVKFSKFTPDVKSAYDLVADGIEIVELAKPALVNSEQEVTSINSPAGPEISTTQAHPRSEVTS